MLITPAFLILIWGLPTLHWIATIKIFLINCSAVGLSAYLIAPSCSMNSISTKVSIRISRSLWGLIMNSRICNIYGKNFITSLWQFLTIVSNLNRSFVVFVQFMYSFLEIIFFKIGSTSFPWSSATLLKPDLVASISIILVARNLTSSGKVFVAWTFRIIENKVLTTFALSNFDNLVTKTSTMEKIAWSPSSLS